MAGNEYIKYSYKWNKYYLSELVELSWMKKSTLKWRIIRMWADKAIDNFEIDMSWKKYEFRGQNYTIKEIQNMLWVALSTTYKMLNKWIIKNIWK